ncbi:peptide chain release factor N(5)-glutamine methyltransferase [Deinococcus sp.]|uniref:peptide chain release factor N(5)-glutamine methyltransferase n=1 Tax=Deinococcus sp. TaxID=47478 RepID=UPI003CC5D1D6
MSAAPPTLETFQRRLTRRLAGAGFAAAAQEVRALLMQVLALDWSALVTAGARELTAQEVQATEVLVARRLAGEPLQHLLGELEWGGVRLKVTPAALIPRPETEWLLHLALEELRGRPAPAVLDVGTGSGALALALKAARPDALLSASDLSPEALALAQQNAERLKLEVQFIHSDLLLDVPGSFDLIVSNPPYLPDADHASASPELRHDPALALYGGPDGLRLARILMRQAPAHLRPGGITLLELDPRNVALLAAELGAADWKAEVRPDLSGRARFLRATLLA